MHLHILAVGQVRAGPERELVRDYRARFERIGRQVGLRSLTDQEIASGGGRDAEAERLMGRVPADAFIVVLDERGQSIPSQEMAAIIGASRDDGLTDMCFLIGGADGHGRAALKAANLKLAFGPQTWPHRLARVMLSEQLYRAASILAGTPYHKD